MVLGESMHIGKFRIFLLQIAAVRQENPAELQGCRRAVHRTSEAKLDQARDIAAMVDMGMSQNNGVDRRGIQRRRGPVAQPQLFVALKQSAIDQYSSVAGVQ